ncbi:glycine--tRNA ligase subunit beta [Halalkalibacter akibai]|uniref:Glycine--tRNA ligase beta subunit n=1 Tax=Halalkalibacter akibai (strain ATCC 43226 / DSM 21942 / CIP 109018 / JCM 9157 / 1139) TaxID=1236973 RepID=W4QMV7_HALA3|nr:glycine--tRNA ligase subunit beta [Halalkalibacter akibai]GAE33406.1 glycyl-tRNA synthetase beta chain [Halalkalibacter akibai JCM 9157]
MNKRDFLLEVGLEELPARFVTDSMNQLKDKVEAWLKEERLDYDAISAYATPRRLAVMIEGLAESQPDIEEEAKGPAKKIAYDNEGNWSKAAIGFARGQGVNPDDLFFKELKGIEYIYANKFVQGKQTVELLPALKEIITSLHFPKNMRWGSNDLRFARPIRWLVALYGKELIPFSITSIETGSKSFGHRFLGKEIEISEPAEYKFALLGEYVIVDPVERKRAIRNQIEAMTEGNDWIIPIDEELLEEVTHLVEYPTALSGGFDESFLKLPKEVLITSMKEHQRYFPVENKEGQLLPFFITVRNGDHQHLDNVSKGNEKVLRARLSDAAFFYAEDQKLNINDALNRLEQIVYHEELGSIGDKVRRVGIVVQRLSELLQVDESTKKVATRIAEIAKFDLVTQMVGEFPELQGRMGEVYAELAGESKEVATGINEHYQPRFSGDDSPTTLASTIVSLAEKLDTIVTCFAIGLIPTGSQDPYALRRQAAGVVQMINDHQLDVELEQLLTASLEVIENRKLLKRESEEVRKDLIDFFKLRVRALIQDQGIQYDVIDAVFMDQIGHVPTIMKKAKLISEVREEEAFKKVVEALSRVTNISKKSKSDGEIQTEYFEKDEEKVLFEHYLKLRVHVEEALQQGDVKSAYQALASSEPVINQYFDHIMVMTEDLKVRDNRLYQMRELAAVIQSFAQFQAIVFA